MPRLCESRRENQNARETSLRLHKAATRSSQENTKEAWRILVGGGGGGGGGGGAGALGGGGWGRGGGGGWGSKRDKWEEDEWGM